jgi:uncharacterized damage-inducible protein DinB
MSALNSYRAMSRYNRWMNENLYTLAATLSDAQRKHDSGAFFKSIHGTLNHLLLGDRVWLGRFTDTPFVVKSLSDELYADFDTLRIERSTTDQAIIDWIDALTERDLTGALTYKRVNGKTSSLAKSLCVTHFFNHQTHHRGQVTTLLSQQGIDPGVTDLIAMPEAPSFFANN